MFDSAVDERAVKLGQLSLSCCICCISRSGMGWSFLNLMLDLNKSFFLFFFFCICAAVLSFVWDVGASVCLLCTGPLQLFLSLNKENIQKQAGFCASLFKLSSRLECRRTAAGPRLPAPQTEYSSQLEQIWSLWKQVCAFSLSGKLKLFFLRGGYC